MARLLSDDRDLRREVRRLAEEQARHEGAAWRAAAETIGGVRSVLRHTPGYDAGRMKALASAVVSEPGLVAVIVGDGTPAPVVAARSSDLGMRADGLVTALAASLGGRGGGRPELAQGGIAASSTAILAFARTWIESGQP